MWEWMTEKAKMPRFVWLGILLILIALAYQIFMAKELLISYGDRSIELARRERKVANKEKRLIEVSDDAIAKLEELKDRTSHPEAIEHFSRAQMTIRDDVKRPLIAKGMPEE